MVLAQWSSPVPRFLSNQVTEFHLGRKMLFCSLMLLCVTGTVTFCQTLGHSPWQTPLYFQRLEGTCEIRTFLGILGYMDTVATGK